MSANTATAPTQPPVVFSPDPTLSGLNFWGAFRSELTKLLSLRTTFWLSLVSLLICLLMGLAVGLTEPWHDQQAIDVVQGTSAAIYFVMILLGSLGVIAITTEFTSGSIRSSLTAVPRRGLLYVTKALALLLVVTVVFVVTILATHILTALLNENLPLASLVTNSEVLTLYATNLVSVLLTAMFGFGLGLLLRSSAGGIVVLAMVIFVVDLAFAIAYGMMQADWLSTILNLQYTHLMADFTVPFEENRDFSRPVAFLGMLTWVAVPNILGVLTFYKRDA